MSAVASPPASRSSALLSLVHLLRCPHCGEALCAGTGSLRCARGHCFDIARDGHVHLHPGHRSPLCADTAAMVAARARWLGAGHFDSLTQLLGEVAAQAALPFQTEDRLLLEVAAGTGHHLARLLDRLPATGGLALDLSPHAVRAAARAHPRLAAAVADVTRPLPVRTGAVSVLACVFGPRNPAEWRRVLDPRGAVLVATPEPARHLQELVRPLGLLSADPQKEERLLSRMAPWFRRAERRTAEVVLRLSRDEARDLVAMGPSVFHLDRESLERGIAALVAPVEVTVSFVVSVFKTAG